MTFHGNGLLGAVFLTAGLALLSGCGGGATVVRSVPFEGPVSGADYVGKTFPVYLLVGEPGDPSGSAIAGRGSVTYNSDGSITLLLPRRAPIVFAPTGSTALGTTYTSAAGSSSTIDAVVTGFSSTNAFRVITSTADEQSFLGGFGFETLPAERPASATYDVAGAVFLTSRNAEDFLPIAGDGTLIADFAANSISGTLLSTDPVEVELAGAPTSPDELALQFMLEDGRITSSGFTGGVRATGELVIDGGGAPVALDADIANDSAEGAFFGAEAAAVAGTFEGDLSLSDGATPLADFDAAGFVSGAKR